MPVESSIFSEQRLPGGRMHVVVGVQPIAALGEPAPVAACARDLHKTEAAGL
ncbi:hypothetical protein [Streptomyces sp. NPDC000880]